MEAEQILKEQANAKGYQEPYGTHEIADYVVVLVVQVVDATEEVADANVEVVAVQEEAMNG